MATSITTRNSETPFTIYSDGDASLPSTPNDIFPFSPEQPSVVQSVEQESSPLSTRRTSAITTTTGISSFPGTVVSEKPYILQKPRTVFRSPSTFPSRQMTSPHSVGSLGSTHSRRFGTPKRRGAQDLESHLTDAPDTPRSLRSPSVISNHSHTNSHIHRSDVDSIRSGSRSSTPSKSQAHLPLVLLHVTLLPPSHPHYSQSLLEKAGAPSYVAENQRLLEEKLSDMVRTRGILITHPGEEYDLLEERLLESLELWKPRVLGCGHFYGGEKEMNDILEEDSVSDSERESIDSELTAGENADDVCSDCEGRMRLPGMGIGSGNRRFDIKIYAANGLMRAGAWAAAWREMERVDVEIDVWMPEEVSRTMDVELQKQEEEELKHQEREESMLQRADAEIEALSRANEEAMAAREEAEKARLRADEHAAQLRREVDRLLSASTDSTPTPIPELTAANKAAAIARRSSSADSRRRSTINQDASLATLARKALVLASQDPRNLALLGLSFLVLLLAFGIGGSSSPPTHIPAAATQLQTHHCAPYSSSFSFSSIPTSTTTITNTIVVTSSSPNNAESPTPVVVVVDNIPRADSSPAVPDSHVPSQGQRQEDSASSPLIAPTVSGATIPGQVHPPNVPPEPPQAAQQ